jgi:alpha,alpha-trehalose phosphorylase
MRAAGGRLAFSPRLPSALTRLSFRVRYRDRRIGVTTDGETATYRLLAGDPLPLRHHGDEFELGAEPVTLPIPHQPLGQHTDPNRPRPHRRKIEARRLTGDRSCAQDPRRTVPTYPVTDVHDEHEDEAQESSDRRSSPPSRYDKPGCSTCSARS